jgi:hypothetical protein
MATDLNLKWEWPADRQPEFTLVVALTDVNVADESWFGIKESPSLLEAMPDPITLKGIIVKGDTRLKDKTVSVTLPKLEAGPVRKGDVLAVGVSERKVCICIKRLQSTDEDISNWKC